MLDIKRILCPVDFSDASKHALTQAALVATWFDARLTLLHVVAPVFVPARGISMAGYRGEPVAEAGELRRLRDEIGSWSDETTGGQLSPDVEVDAGPPARMILERASSLPADLIVLGTHGTSGFERLVLGSVTEKLLRKAACPVLTVPPRAAVAAALPFKRVLCAIDFSDASLAALEAAWPLAKESDAELTLLHVVESALAPPVPASLVGALALDPEAYLRALEQDASKRLAALVPQTAKEWCSPKVAVRAGKAWTEILREAEADHADLIILGVHGHFALDHLTFGSTTNQVVRRAVCPVLTVQT